MFGESPCQYRKHHLPPGRAGTANK
jgi:hypothetical protein